jgi:hypothetical protein
MAYNISEDGDIGRRGRKIPRSEIGVLYNLTGHHIEHERIETATNPLPPIVNENAAHALGRDKMRLHTEILEPLGASIPTALIKSEEDAAAFIEEHEPAKGFVLKPNNGYAGLGIRQLAIHEVLPYLHRHPEYLMEGNEHILQPAYDFTHPLPLLPLDGEAAPSFTYWNNVVARKELRMYTFVSPHQTTIFPVGRTIRYEDKWFFVRPDTVPDRVQWKAIGAAQNIAAATGSRALLAALDLGYGSLPGGEPEWRIIEANTAYPYVINRNESHERAVQLIRSLIAGQIIETLQST